MDFIKFNYRPSVPVNSYREIKGIVREMIPFVNQKFSGPWEQAYAVSHCQVCENAYAFFVVNRELVRKKLFRSAVIINPEILEAEKVGMLNLGIAGKPPIAIPNTARLQEACLSFPHRKSKIVERFNVIKVRYQVPAMFGLRLKTVIARLGGLPSQIFQHETEHCQGKNVFYE